MTKEDRELIDRWRLNGYFQGDGGIVMDRNLTRKVDALIDRLARVEEAASRTLDAYDHNTDAANGKGEYRLLSFQMNALRHALAAPPTDEGAQRG